MADDEKPLTALEFGTLIHRMILDGPDEELGFGFLQSMRPRRGELPRVVYVSRHPPGWMTSMLDDPIRGMEINYAFPDDPYPPPVNHWPVDVDPITDIRDLTRKMVDELYGRADIQLLYESPDCGRVMVEHVEEFENWGPGDARIGNALVDIKTYGRRPAKSLTVGAYHGLDDPVPYVVEFGDALPFHHQVQQRPWSTPNRKRFKRANRRKK